MITLMKYGHNATSSCVGNIHGIKYHILTRRPQVSCLNSLISRSFNNWSGLSRLCNPGNVCMKGFSFQWRKTGLSHRQYILWIEQGWNSRSSLDFFPPIVRNFFFLISCNHVTAYRLAFMDYRIVNQTGKWDP